MHSSCNLSFEMLDAIGDLYFEQFLKSVNSLTVFFIVCYIVKVYTYLSYGKRSRRENKAIRLRIHIFVYLYICLYVNYLSIHIAVHKCYLNFDWLDKWYYVFDLLTLLIFPKKSGLPRFCLKCMEWLSCGYRPASVQLKHSIITNSTQIVVMNFNWNIKWCNGLLNFVHFVRTV